MSKEEHKKYIRVMLEKINSEHDLKQIFDYTQRKFVKEENHDG